MSVWWWMAAALAADLPWSGDWALDPTQSDEGPRVIEQLVQRAPTSAGGLAASYSPDPASGQQTRIDDRQRLVDALTHLLSRSGRIEIDSVTDGVEVTWAGEEPVSLLFGKKWTKVKWGDSKVRIRANRGSSLVLERRVAGASMVETFLPITEAGEAAVVVRIDGAGVDAREFRRVYRDVTTP